jgi:hypothetical protein
MKYPKIGVRDFTITNSTMHHAHFSARVIQPDMIKKYIKLIKSQKKGEYIQIIIQLNQHLTLRLKIRQPNQSKECREYRIQKQVT